jgi:hypothetical protein
MLVETPLGMPAARPVKRRRHLLIAGTGRTGTSFLVRFLAEAGLDTHLGRPGKIEWDEAAQAGLEDLPLSTLGTELPFVLKQPWSYQMIEDILADPVIELQAAIIPMRNLLDAASSRAVVELRAMHETAPWMTELRRSWNHWGTTPGGIVYSLDPVDQSRLLAAGFHHLVEQLVQADVPIVLLAFPRFAEDADYLYTKLRPILPEEVTREMALAAHLRSADATKIRIEDELHSGGAPNGSFPSFEALDNAALRRELLRLRERLAQTEKKAHLLSARLSYGCLQLFETFCRRVRLRRS